MADTRGASKTKAVPVVNNGAAIHTWGYPNVSCAKCGTVMEASSWFRYWAQSGKPAQIAP